MADDRVFRPAALCRLLIRLEDYTEAAVDVPSEDAPFEAQLRELALQEVDLNRILAEARARKQSATAADAARRLAKVKVQAASLRGRDPRARAIDEETGGDPFAVPPILVVPTEVDVELNSWRIADTCSVVIPFRDLPLTEQVVRSALLEVYLGTVPAQDFGSPSRWRLALDRANLVFRGYVDRWKTDHGGEDAVVNIEARDMTAILMDEKVHPASPAYRPKGTGEPITAYINRILGMFPATAGRGGQTQLKALMYRSSQEPVLSRSLLLRQLQSAKSRTDAEGPVVADPAVEGDVDPGAVEGLGQPQISTEQPQETTLWDLITTACGIVGLAPTYDPAVSLPPQDQPGSKAGAGEVTGDFLLLRPPQTVFENVDGGLNVQGGPQDGFSRVLPDPGSPGAGVRSEVRFLVWGHNVKKMSTSRKLGRIKAPAVEVVAYNPDAPPAQRTLRARFPLKGDKRATKVGATGANRVEEVVTRFVRGVRDLARLQQIAVGLHHSLARPEFEVEIETDDLSSYIDPTRPESHNENPDLLKLRHGTPVRVVVARQVQDPERSLVLTPLSDVFERRTDELRRFLVEQNQRYRPDVDPDLSQSLVDVAVSRIATALGNPRQVDLFYTRSVSHRWTAEEGWEGKIELVNYMEVRSHPRALSKESRDLDAVMRLPAGKAEPAPADAARKRARRSQGR